MEFKKEDMGSLIKMTIAAGSSEESLIMLAGFSKEEMAFVEAFGHLGDDDKKVLMLKFGFERKDKVIGEQLEIDDVPGAIDEAMRRLNENAEKIELQVLATGVQAVINRAASEAIGKLLESDEVKGYKPREIGRIIKRILYKSLSEDYPDTSFYVRSHSVEEQIAISIYWMDGPTEKEVANLVQHLEGKLHDGSINAVAPVFHWKKGNRFTRAYSPGTQIQGGVIPGFRKDRPKGASLVHMGVDFIIPDRSFSREFLERIADQVYEENGWPKPDIVEGPWKAGDTLLGAAAVYAQNKVRVPNQDEPTSELYWRVAYTTPETGIEND